MKKFITSLFVLFSIVLGAQSFHKKALVIDVNTNLEIYNTVLEVRIKDPNKTRDTTYNDKAGNRSLGLSAEFGLSKRIGVGLQFKANNYFTSKDSATKATPNVRTQDFVAFVNYHPIIKKHFDLVLGANIGYSNFKYKANDIENLILSGGGSYISIYANPRIYFGRFGINFKVYAPFVNYNNLSTNNTDLNKYIAFTKWKGNGFGLGFGLQYRFLKQ